MAQFFDLTVGSIVVIVLVVIVILWLINRRRCQTQNNIKKYRHAVGVAYDQDFARVPVEHRRRSHLSSSSSSSSSSSDSRRRHDDFAFRPGGLGDLCGVNPNTCAANLACVNGRCACSRPISPVVTAVEQGIDTIVTSWNAVSGANYYDVILYRVTANDMVPVEVVRGLRGITTLTFNRLGPGNYRVDVTAGSDFCGIGPGSVAGIQVMNGVGCEINAQCAVINPTLPICSAGSCVQCTVNTQCAAGQRCTNNSCVQITGQGLNQACVNSLNCAQGLACQNLQCVCPKPPVPQISTVTVVGNDVIVNWTASVGADYYEVVLYRDLLAPAADVPLEVIQVQVATAATFNDLPVGRYRVEVFALSNACGGLEEAGTMTFDIIPCVLPLTVSAVDGGFGPIVDGNRSVNIGWEPVTGADRYSVTIRPTVGGPAVFQTTTTSNIITTNLPINGNFTATIQSVSDECGANPAGATFQFIVPGAPCTVPPPVTELIERAIGGSSVSALDWNDVPTATLYDLFIYNTRQDPVLVGTFLGLTTSQLILDGNYGSATYRADIYAVNACGRSVLASFDFYIRRD